MDPREERTLPEFPEVEAWRRQLEPDVKRYPIAQAGPAHIATLKTFDPPLSVLEGEGFEGARRRAKRFLLPTDDGELVLMVHLMSAGRLRYLHAHEKGPKTPMFALTFSDGGRLVLTEAGAKRRAGVWLLRPDALEAELAHLGPEADTLDAESLAALLVSVSRRLLAPPRDALRRARLPRASSCRMLSRTRRSSSRAPTTAASSAP